MAIKSLSVKCLSGLCTGDKLSGHHAMHHGDHGLDHQRSNGRTLFDAVCLLLWHEVTAARWGLHPKLTSRIMVHAGYPNVHKVHVWPLYNITCWRAVAVSQSHAQNSVRSKMVVPGHLHPLTVMVRTSWASNRRPCYLSQLVTCDQRLLGRLCWHVLHIVYMCVMGGACQPTRPGHRCKYVKLS